MGKENLGKDRYKREGGEGNEGTEYEDTTQDFRRRRDWKVR